MLLGIDGCASDAQGYGHTFDNFSEYGVVGVKVRCTAHAGVGLLLQFIEGQGRMRCHGLLGFHLQSAKQILMRRVVGGFQAM